MNVKSILKILLSKNSGEGVALNHLSLKIKPRFHQGFQRLIIVVFLSLFLLGYQPTLSFPPIQKQPVHAQDTGVQTDTITSKEIPQISLPHPGYLSTRFSYFHPGIDIATGLGMPVRPITEGVVSEVNFWVFGYGHHVIITHPDNLTSLYGHLDRVYVKVGQSVTPETTLGTVGLTGFTSGSHTHLEIRRDGKPIDPLPLLPPLQNYPSAEFLRPVGGNTSQVENLTKSLKPDFH